MDKEPGQHTQLRLIGCMWSEDAQLWPLPDPLFPPCVNQGVFVAQLAKPPFKHSCKNTFACVCTVVAGSRVWAANGAGLVEGLDLKARKMCGGALKGPAGSVRSLALHPAADGLDGDEGVDKSKLIASAGLDRMLRVHSTQSRAVQGKVYLKQQLTGVAWLPVPELEADQGEGHGRGGEADEEEDDEAGELQGAAGEAVGRGAGGRSKSKKEHKKDGSKKPRSK